MSRFPSALWCSALGWISPSDLLDVAPDLGAFEPAKPGRKSIAVLKKQLWICLAAGWGLLSFGVVVGHRAHHFPCRRWPQNFLPIALFMAEGHDPIWVPPCCCSLPRHQITPSKCHHAMAQLLPYWDPLPSCISKHFLCSFSSSSHEFLINFPPPAPPAPCSH